MAGRNSDTFRRSRLAVPGAVLALSLAACGGATGTSSALGATAAGATATGATATPNAAGTGAATLSWTTVSASTNGAPLTDLAGYKVYYGTSANDMSTVVVVADPGATSYLLTSLSSGTWYFAVAAYTGSGTQGLLSNVASKTIN